MTEDELLTAARQARAHALCRYSGFAVGVALRDGEGRIWTGANVENASWTLGLCAERVALFYALAQGARDFDVLVLATEAAEPATPCGACRQVLREFAPRLTVISTTPSSQRRFVIEDLLPDAFTDATLVTARPTR